jgi:hypothetical protein
MRRNAYAFPFEIEHFMRSAGSSRCLVSSVIPQRLGEPMSDAPDLREQRTGEDARQRLAATAPVAERPMEAR